MRVQRGTTTLQSPTNSTTATIAAVDTNKAFCRMLGASLNGYAGGAGGHMCRVSLENATTVRVVRESVWVSEIVVVSWEVVDF